MSAVDRNSPSYHPLRGASRGAPQVRVLNPSIKAIGWVIRHAQFLPPGHRDFWRAVNDMQSIVDVSKTADNNSY